jgi:hypothetical protein
MAPSNPDSYVLQEPKTRLHPGITGPKMAADTPYREPEPEPQPSDHKDPTAAESYSGLEVVETGIEVVPPSPLPEALSPPHQHQQQQLPQMQYAEYKPWAQRYSPPEPLPPNPGYPPQPATAPDYRYNGGHNPFEPPGGGRICGLRKVVFWAVLAIAAFAVVAAVAVGLGVGLGTRSNAGYAVFLSFNSLPPHSPPPIPSSSFTLCPRGSSCPAATEDATRRQGGSACRSPEGAGPGPDGTGECGGGRNGLSIVTLDLGTLDLGTLDYLVNNNNDNYY